MNGTTPTQKPLFDDLKIRSGVAVIFALIAFFFIWLGGTAFTAFMSIIAAVMLTEFTSLVRSESSLENIPKFAMIALGAISIIALDFSGLAFTFVASVGLLIAATLNKVRLGKATIVGYAIIVIGAASTVHIRELTAGLPMIVWIILCVAAADIGGYMFGRLLQGPKLLPRVSPKKTWSGFLGGVLLSVIVAIIFSFFSGGASLNLILFGVIIAVVSVAGDLLESSMKRKFGVKDASSLLPGHGGFLDRLDGMTIVMLAFAALSFMTDISALFVPEYVALIGSGM